MSNMPIEKDAAAGASRPRWQVSVTITASGYVELEAEDAEAARSAVQGMEADVHFLGSARFHLDTSLFDHFADIIVDSVCEVEPEEPADGAAATGAGKE